MCMLIDFERDTVALINLVSLAIVHKTAYQFFTNLWFINWFKTQLNPYKTNIFPFHSFVFLEIAVLVLMLMLMLVLMICFTMILLLFFLIFFTNFVASFVDRSSSQIRIQWSFLMLLTKWTWFFFNFLLLLGSFNFLCKNESKTKYKQPLEISILNNLIKLMQITITLLSIFRLDKMIVGSKWKKWNGNNGNRMIACAFFFPSSILCN